MVIQVGDIVEFKLPSHVKKDSPLVGLAKQYDSPCVVYQVKGCWAYLYRLLDGRIQLSMSLEYWYSCDVDISNYLDKWDAVTHLMDVCASV